MKNGVSVDLENIDYEKLPQKVRWAIADLLIEERLEIADVVCKEVKVKKTIYSCYVKRLLDIVISGVALLVFFPVNLVIGIISFVDVGQPLFFKQERTGLNGENFKIIKFRSMSNEKNDSGELLPAEQRVTKWGMFIRKTSLDELLNFWSIFKGDMSVIGPRPLPPQYYNRYSKRHRERHSVRPGLECPVYQKDGKRNGWHGQFENDIWYVENVSFLTDVKLLFRLFVMVFDKKERTNRGNGMRGDFIGYSEDGTEAISVYEVSENHVLRALKRCNIEVDEVKMYV